MRTANPKLLLAISMGLFCFMGTAQAEPSVNNYCQPSPIDTAPQTKITIANELGWVAADNRCGGYYLEPPFKISQELLNNKSIKVTGNEGVFSLHGTSTYEGKVTITQDGQEVITNKAYVYRNPTTEKYSGIDLIGNVSIREPDTLILARCGHVDLENNSKVLRDILYRTAIYSRGHQKPTPLTPIELQHEHKVYQLSAWGQAAEFKQDEPEVYKFQAASYSTCPPLNIAWKVKADSITLDKNAGRGIARNAKLLVNGIPVFYAPYLNFPIDSRRQSGFLWPTVGSSSTSGGYLTVPFYWNMAPNYDYTITPSALAKRGLQINNLFRYLSDSPTNGEIKFVILPYDQFFKEYKASQIRENEDSTDEVIQSQLHSLESASLTRYAISWQNKTQFNEHWNTSIDYNHVSDDYYLRDFSNGLNQITPNQILQQGDLNYKGQYWLFTGRLQGYQTLHPLQQNDFYNQYIRLPQIILDGTYPDDRTGLTFFINNDLTHFNIMQNPGNLNPGHIDKQPIGNRYNIQPGVNLPIYRPSYYFNPRLQVAATKYEIGNVEDDNSKGPSRVLPIFDINSGLYFDRNISLFNYQMRQTLEPKMYYTYVPYKNQSELPNFDTTINTLTYDQLFTYNRFAGLDRIGDANQISLGVITRFIDQESGFEKISAGIGQIFYFENRRVTLCTAPSSCTDAMNAPENTNNRSPLSAVLSYNLNPNWHATSYTIWDSQENQFDNQTLTLQYLKDIQRAVSFSYTYVRNGDLPQNPQNESGKSTTNLSQTDFSFTWPVSRDWGAIARWTQNWNRSRFQNLLYGLQYDTCCWAVRVVAGRTFNNLTPNDTNQYNTEFYLQFALKGLGTFGTGNPGQKLNNASIANQNNFGQDY